MDESGSALIEVMVSAVLIVIVAGGVLLAIQSATRATAEERHRAQAQTVTEADQARMRTMQISDLASLNQTRTVNVDGTPYTVHSRGQYVTEGTGTEECTDDASGVNASYVKLTSTVTWPSMGSRPAVVSNSLMADRLRGLAVSVLNSEGDGIPGIGVSGSGAAGSFSGSTGPTGCARFGGLGEGNYTLNVSTPGYVDEDGNAPQPETVSVVDGSMNVKVLVYDNPGTIPVSFTTKPYGAGSGTAPVATSTDTVMAFNTGMSGAKMFGTAGTRANSVTASSLFPFTSPYAIYSGTCESDEPGAGAALGSVLVPRGGIQSAALQLPALFLTVMSGSSSSSPGSPVVGATVRIADTKCPDDPTTAFKRTFTTGANGRLVDPLNTGTPTRPPGLPSSTYNICAHGLVSGTNRRLTTNNVAVQNLSTGTTLTVYLQGTGSTTGTCPT